MLHWVHLHCANQEKSIWLWWFSNPVENCELYVFLPISIIRRIIAKVEAKQVHHCLLVALLWKRQHCITKVLYVLSANAKFLRKSKTVGMELHLAICPISRKTSKRMEFESTCRKVSYSHRKYQGINHFTKPKHIFVMSNRLIWIDPL